MNFSPSWFFKPLRVLLYNSKVRNWRLTSAVYNLICTRFVSIPEKVEFPEEKLILRIFPKDTSAALPLLNKQYENLTIEILKALLKDAIASNLTEPIIFADVGANIGLFTTILSRVSHRVRIFAFEPNKTTFNLLTENVMVNQIKNARLMNVAVGQAKGCAHLDITSDCAGTHSFYTSGHRMVEVPIISLDEFFSAENAVPSLIKIDVEGYEPKVMAGMKNILNAGSPSVILEFNPVWLSRGGHNPKDFLSELGSMFNAIYCIDEVAGKLYRFSALNRSLTRKLLSFGYNLLLTQNPLPAQLLAKLEITDASSPRGGLRRRIPRP